MKIGAYFNAPVPRWAAFGAVIASSVATGLAVYRYTNEKLSAEYDLRLDQELRATGNFYKALKKEDFPTPEDAVKSLIAETNEMLDEMHYTSDDSTVEEEPLTEVSHNVFTNADASVWDADAEEAQRDPSKPYIIEHDEFYESNWNSVTLTFFEGDGILSDEKDEHIPDTDNVVGDENLTKFGHGSRDPNILYVKNEGLDLIFEIVRAEGKYTEQVMGFVQHDDSRSRRPRKFHLDED